VGKGLLFGERRIASHVLLCLDFIGLSLRDLSFSIGQLTFGLINYRLKSSRIDFEEQLAFFNKRAVCVVLAQKVSGYLRLDLRVDQPVQRADPLPPDRNILLLYLHHRDIRRTRLRLRGFCAATRSEHNRTQPTLASHAEALQASP